MTISRRWLALVLVVAGTTAAVSWVRARSAPEDGSRALTVTGVVVSVRAGGEIAVAHDDIAGYMPAMTMPFKLSDSREAAGLAPGDRIRFTLRVGDTWSRAEDVTVTGRGPVPLGPPRAPSPARLKTGDAMPAFSLVDQAGRPFTEADLAGKVTAVTFIFTRCPVPEYCPTIVTRFREIQAAIAKDAGLRPAAQLLSVTLDPEYDTPQVLAAYASAMRADAPWRFLTGETAAVAGFAKAFAIHTERNGPLLDHTLATAVIDGRGRVRQIWRGTVWRSGEVGSQRGMKGARGPE